MYILFFLAQSDEDLVKTAKSIFEFSAKDIDGNTVSLDKYRLVVSRSRGWVIMVLHETVKYAGRFF